MKTNQTDKQEPRSRPIPIRFRPNESARIENANQLMGIDNRSAIVRFAVHLVLPQIEAGQIQIPKSFLEREHA